MEFLGVFALTQIPLAVIEGLVTTAAVLALEQCAQPELRLLKSWNDLLIAAALLAVIPLALLRDTDFAGADGAAEEIVQELDPDYEPIAQPILEPPGGETESLLFCLQAALGAGVLGFGFGWLAARKKYQSGGSVEFPREETP